jgi:hypothetical protein
MPSSKIAWSPFAGYRLITILGWLAGSGLLHGGNYFLPPVQSEYPEDIRARQPPGLTLTLSLPKNHFFQGEEIPATLTFSNKSPAPYHLMDAANWDRSRGVMGDIAFYAQNDKGLRVADPVAWYLRRCIGIEGGGGTIVNLGQWSMTIAANQWLRFDHPGVYAIFAWSERVQTGAYRDFRDLSGGDQVQLVSNRITVTIDPITPQEEHAVIEEAHKIISRPKEASFMPGRTPPDVTEALHRLCCLQTAAARNELFSFLSEGNNDTGRLAALGILGAPDPKAVAPALLAAVEKGEPVLNEYAVQVYAALKTYDFPGGGFFGQTFPITPFTQAVEDAKNEITKAAEKASGEEGPTYIGALWAAFQQKPQDPATRAALAQHQLEMSADQRKQLISMWQLEVWGDGQPQDPAMIESSKQFRQGGLDFLPVLRQTASAPDYDPYALAILCKLEPIVARPLVIQDIKRDHSLYLTKPKMHFGAPMGLDTLPDQPIPELTETFHQRLLQKYTDSFFLLPLIDRYGTPDLLPGVEHFYQTYADELTGIDEIAYRRFCIRCNPEEGMANLEKSIQSRKDPRYSAFILEKVFDDRWDDLALPLAKKSLQATYPEMVISAIRILESHGSQDCVESVISALERIHNTAYPRIPNEEPSFIEKAREGTLAKELLRNQRWKYTPAQEDRLDKVAQDH